MRSPIRRQEWSPGSARPARLHRSLVALLAAVLAVVGPLVALGIGTAPPSSASVGPPVISTFAGGPEPGVPDPLLANDVQMAPTDVVFASVSGGQTWPPLGAGQYVYVADAHDDVVRSIAISTGDETVLAGDGAHGPTASGYPATGVALDHVAGIAVDAAGDLAIADEDDNVVQFVPAQNCAAGSCPFAWPGAMVAGDIYTVAGNGTNGANGNDGPGTSAELDAPAGVAFTAAGDIVIADSGNSSVRLLSNTGCGSGSCPFGYGGVMFAGDLYTVAGTLDASGYSGDQSGATFAELDEPTGVAVVPTGEPGAGSLAIADRANNVIRFVAATGCGAGSCPLGYATAMTAGDIYTVAGGGANPSTCSGSTDAVGDGCAAIQATFDEPGGVSFDPNGNLVISDSGEGSTLPPGGLVRLLPTASGSADGRTLAKGVVVDLAGALDPATSPSPDGTAATSAGLDAPAGAAVDASGDVVIADTLDEEVSFVPVATGTNIGEAMNAGELYAIGGEVAAGDSGSTDTDTGDGGPAIQAELATGGPLGVTTDAADDVIIADTYNNVVRLVPSANCIAGSCPFAYPGAMTAGDIYTVAGGAVTECAGETDVLGDGCPPIEAILQRPTGVSVDPAGNLLIVDSTDSPTQSGDGVIRVVAAATGTFYGVAMTAGHIYTVAGGTGTLGTTCAGANAVGDGCPAADAIFNKPSTVSLDGSGDLIIADTGDDLVRLVAEHSCAAGSCPFGYPAAMTTGHVYTVAGWWNPALAENNGLGDGTCGVTSGSLATGAAGGNGVCTVYAALSDAAGNLIIDAGGGPASNGGVDQVDLVAGSSCAAGSCPYGLAGPLTAGDIYTLAGDGSPASYLSGSPAASAGIGDPDGLALDANGDILFGDTGSGLLDLLPAKACGGSGQPVCTGTFGITPLVLGDLYTVGGGTSELGDGNDPSAASLGEGSGTIDDSLVLGFDRADAFLFVGSGAETRVRMITENVPGAPIELQASGATASAVNLSWAPAGPAGTITDSAVFRCTSATGSPCTPATELGTLGAGVTSYTDPTVSSGHFYYYSVEATDASPSSGTSAQSTPLYVDVTGQGVVTTTSTTSTTTTTTTSTTTTSTTTTTMPKATTTTAPPAGGGGGGGGGGTTSGGGGGSGTAATTTTTSLASSTTSTTTTLPAGGTTGKGGHAKLRISGTHVVRSAGDVQFELSCTGATCSGMATLYRRVTVSVEANVISKRGKKHTEAVARLEFLVVGSVNFSVNAGGHESEQIPLDALATKALAKASRRHRHVHLQLRVTMGKATKVVSFKAV